MKAQDFCSDFIILWLQEAQKTEDTLQLVSDINDGSL